MHPGVTVLSPRSRLPQVSHFRVFRGSPFLLATTKQTQAGKPILLGMTTIKQEGVSVVRRSSSILSSTQQCLCL